MGAFLGCLTALQSADCNGNGFDDSMDIAAQDFGFVSERPVASGNSPILVDLNGDGNIDLATSQSGGGVQILLGNGTGTFRDAVNYTVPVQVASSDPPVLVAADLDGDGKPDLAMANGCRGCGVRGQVSLLLNRGDGTFADAVSYPTGNNPQLLIAADLNADGKLDLVSGGGGSNNLGSNDIVVLLNNGDGKFRDALPIADGSGMWFLIAADLNNDGKPDLAAADEYSDPMLVKVLLNRGDGVFIDTESYPAGVHFRHSLIAADLNGDAYPEIVTSSGDFGQVSILDNQGDGTFGVRALDAIGWNPRNLIAPDLNSDGKPDLAWHDEDLITGVIRLSVRINQGDGTFKDGIRYYTRGSKFLIAADLSGDGRPDLATANGGSGDVSILLNQGDGTFQDAEYYPVGGNPCLLIAADLNGDGKLDLAIADYGGALWVRLNQGDGVFRDSLSYPVGSGWSHPGAVAVDLNEDGRPDFVTTWSSNVSILLNHGNGTLHDAVDYAVGAGAGSLIAADLDNDGTPDVATANYGCFSCNPRAPASISVLLNRGDGTLLESVNHSVGYGAADLIVTDLNADGKADLMTSTGCIDCNPPVPAGVTVLLNKGDGNFQNPGDYSVSMGPGSVIAYHSLIAADFNDDGLPDLAMGRCCAPTSIGDVFVLLNEGHDTFDAGTSYPVSGAMGVLVARDFNGDGQIDVAATHGTDGPPSFVSIFLNEGGGKFAKPVSNVIGYSPTSLISADFNLDGRFDLAAANQDGEHEVSVLLNQAGGRFRVFNYVVARDLNTTSLIAADFDRDGTLDLAVPGFFGGVSVMRNSGYGSFKAHYTVVGGHPELLITAQLNGDTRPDILALGNNGVTVLLNHTSTPLSLDLNRNSIPDECELSFHRGDPNNDGRTNLSDGIFLFNFLFLGGNDPSCMESADSNSDRKLDISDGTFLLNFLFLGGPPPASPGASPAPCGLSPPGPGVHSKLGCLAYNHCP
jgi:hypothetical protein